MLCLEKLLSRQHFMKSWLWCGAAVVLAPILPTMAVLGLAMVGSFSVLLNLMRDAQRDLFYVPMNRYIWMYAAIYLVGTFFSVNLKGSLLGGMLTVAFVLFTIMLENSITTRRQLDVLIAMMVLAGTVVALYGILQYLFGWGYQSTAWVDTEMFGDSFRVPSTLENPNMLGQYLILAIPLGGAGLLSAKDWGQRVWYFICCGIMCVCMLLTLSRGAWLGLLFAGFVFVLFLQPRLLLLTPIALVALYFCDAGHHYQPVCHIGDLGDSSTSYRVFIWMGTLAMLKDYWLCGIGPGDAAFQSGLSQIQLQRYCSPPLPQPVSADCVRRGHCRPGHLCTAPVPLLPGHVRLVLPGEGLVYPFAHRSGGSRYCRLPGSGHDRLLLL